MNKFRCTFSVASVTIGVEAPWPIKFEEAFKEFYIPWESPEIIYRFMPLKKEKDLTKVEGQKFVYSDGEAMFRVVYGKLPEEAELLVYKKSERLFYIYYPEEFINEIKDDLPEVKITSMISWEENFLDHNGFYLHSSCVSLNGEGVVFTAPSGTGKSTQASLWEECLGVETINGDRTIIKREEDGWKGYGSPYAGSSYIFKNKSIDLKAIIILEQGKENVISKVSPREAFITLYKETVQNPWNPEYMDKMMNLLERAIQEIPIYRLTCRPDKGAVELVYQTVFGKRGEE